MIPLGAMLAAIAVASLTLGLRGSSAVLRRLAIVAPSLRGRGPLRRWRPAMERDLAQSGLGWGQHELALAKVIGAAAGAVAVGVLANVLPVGPIAIVVAAYAGFVAPSLAVERRAAARRAMAERGLGTLVEWIEALVAAGRPVESALLALGHRPLGLPVLDDAIRRSTTSYALGAPLYRSLAREGEAAGLPGLASLADQLDRARDLGRGSLAVIRDERERLRAAERSRGLDAASRVEGRLMLVLVLCYLPALMLLVVIPLFLTLLEGLAG